MQPRSRQKPSFNCVAEDDPVEHALYGQRSGVLHTPYTEQFLAGRFLQQVAEQNVAEISDVCEPLLQEHTQERVAEKIADFLFRVNEGSAVQIEDAPFLQVQVNITKIGEVVQTTLQEFELVDLPVSQMPKES